MRTTYRLFLLLFITGIAISCKKEKKGACWQLIDNLGNELGQVCDKTAADMQQQYPNCAYYQLESARFCWMLNGVFTQNEPEAKVNLLVKCFGFTAVKVDCGFCEKWYTREKYTYKPNNSFTYGSVRFTQFCGDTLRTLFPGREVILRNTTDSLVVVQFSKTGIF